MAIEIAAPHTEQTPSIGEPNSIPHENEKSLNIISPEAKPSDNTPHKTPFPHPLAKPTIIHTPAPLTVAEEAAYKTLLSTVSSWASQTATTPSDPTPTPTPAPSSTEISPSTLLPLSDLEKIWLTRECLLRYLRASTWSIPTATTRLLSTLSWRRTYGLYTKLTPEYISPENTTGKQWILGFDNAARPCLYLNPSRQNTQRSERQIEHLVYMLERSIELCPAGQETIALLIDFEGTRTGQGASIAQGRQTLNILQSHYPERLGRALLCHLPWHISTFMRLTTPFIDPNTRAKIVFNQPMREHVPAEQLRVSHGGDVPFEYDHDVYWPALTALARERREAEFERWLRIGGGVGVREGYLKGVDSDQDQESNLNLS